MSKEEYSNDTKIAVLQNTNTHIHETLHRIEIRLDKIDDKFSKLEEKFDKINNKLWELLFFTIGGFVGIFYIVAHGLKWF